MPDMQKNSVSKNQVPPKTATRRQGRRRIIRLLWILIALGIAIGLAFLPRNQDSPTMEIQQEKNISEMLLHELGIGLSNGFWRSPIEGNEIMKVELAIQSSKETLIHD